MLFYGRNEFDLNQPTPMELIATCAFGLEKLVENELRKLKLWTVKTEDGRVTFEADEAGLIKANLWLRCADRVQIKTKEFSATTFDQLFDEVNAIEWEKYIGVSDAFPVHATSTKSILHSEPAIQSITKKAIVKRLQQKYKLETLPENSGITYQIVVKTNKDQFIVCLDTSGESLHKRGYRLKANSAPIKETLAAAMVKLSDWLPQNSENILTPIKRALVDPFCGSGTIAIEAAMIACNIAPGLNREFAFQKWPWINKEIFEKLKEEAKKMAQPKNEFSIYCFDIDAEVLKIAEENANRAGLTNINFRRADFNDLDFNKFENCTFVTNPPYGERLEEKSYVMDTYRKLGQKFSQTQNCSLFLITSNEHFSLLFGRPADKNRKLFNGNIKCYLYSYFPKPN